MTKIRSGNSTMIDDRRGSGSGLGGGGFPIPIKAGGGVLGIIVLLASILLPEASWWEQQCNERAATARQDWFGDCRHLRRRAGTDRVRRD